MFYLNRIKDLEEDVEDLFKEIEETDEMANDAMVEVEKLEDKVEDLESLVQSHFYILVNLMKIQKITPKQFAKASMAMVEADTFTGKVNAEMTKLKAKKVVKKKKK